MRYNLRLLTPLRTTIDERIHFAKVVLGVVPNIALGSLKLRLFECNDCKQVPSLVKLQKASK